LGLIGFQIALELISFVYNIYAAITINGLRQLFPELPGGVVALYWGAVLLSTIDIALMSAGIHGARHKLKGKFAGSPFVLTVTVYLNAYAIGSIVMILFGIAVSIALYAYAAAAIASAMAHYNPAFPPTTPVDGAFMSAGIAHALQDDGGSVALATGFASLLLMLLALTKFCCFIASIVLAFQAVAYLNLHPDEAFSVNDDGEYGGSVVKLSSSTTDEELSSMSDSP
jgi:hypothetical protein